MKFLTSYFYAVRWMQPTQIPISTAMWDPKWFHAGRGPQFQFKDKRGIINGLRAAELVPAKVIGNLCGGADGDVCEHDPNTCAFLAAYRLQLDAMDFDKFLQSSNNILTAYSMLHHVSHPIITFLFHETPTNPCSERVVVTQWLRDHGQEVEEFDWRRYKR